MKNFHVDANLTLSVIIGRVSSLDLYWEEEMSLGTETGSIEILEFFGSQESAQRILNLQVVTSRETRQKDLENWRTQGAYALE